MKNRNYLPYICCIFLCLAIFISFSVANIRLNCYVTHTVTVTQYLSSGVVEDEEEEKPPSGWFGSLVDNVTNGIKGIFIPDKDFMTDYFNDLKIGFENKIPFVGQCIDLFQSFIDTLFSSSSEPPKFIITLDGKEHNIIDFETFDEYMPIVRGIILVVCYFNFIRKTIKRLPTIINNAPVENEVE